jgi:hypothetical protein
MLINEILQEGYKEAVTEFSIIAGKVKASQVIDQYKELVNKNQVSGSERNIDYWRKQGWDKFSVLVSELSSRPTITSLKRKKVPGKSIIVSESSEWLIVIPLDRSASCYYGRKTSWCTAKPNQTYFDDYISRGVLLIYCLREDGTLWAIASSTQGNEYFTQDNQSLSESQFEYETGLDPIVIIESANQTPELLNSKKLEQAVVDREELRNSTSLREYLPRDLEIEQEIVTKNDASLASRYMVTAGPFSNINHVSDELKMLVIQYSPFFIDYISHMVEAAKIKAVKANWRAVEYIKNPSYKLQELAIPALEASNYKYNWQEVLKGIGYDQSPVLQLAAIKFNPELIENIYNPSKEVKAYIQQYAPQLASNILDPRDSLTWQIQDARSNLVIAQNKYQTQVDEVTQHNSYFNQIRDRMPKESLESHEKYLVATSEYTAVLKSRVDDIEKTLALYQQRLAQLSESYELTRIKQLIGI